MKRTPLKKKGKTTSIGTLETKADRSLQDWFRWKFKNKLCDVCGVNHFHVMHHFVPKSQSIGLRFEKSNLIFICDSCHFKHHRCGDPSIHAKVMIERGNGWYEKLNKLRIERKSWKKTKTLYEEMIQKYSIKK